MSFSGKISKRKNSGAVLLGTFMVPAAFSAASQNVSAVGNNMAQTAQSSSDVSEFLKRYGKETLVAVLAVFALGGIVAAIYYFINKRVVSFGDVFCNKEEISPTSTETTRERFLAAFSKCTGKVYKVKKKDLYASLCLTEEASFIEKLKGEVFFVKIRTINLAGFLTFSLFDADGKEVSEEVFRTNYVINNWEKVLAFSNYLKGKDVKDVKLDDSLKNYKFKEYDYN